MRARTVSLIQSCFPSSAAVYHARNHNRLSGVVCVRVCVHLQTPPLPYSQGHTILSVFFFLSRNLGGSLVLVAGFYRAKTGSSIWQDPGVEGRHEPAAHEKAGEALEIVTLAKRPCTSICRAVLCEATQHAKLSLQGATWRDLMSPICLFDVDCSVVRALVLKRTLCGMMI